jgi:hypothetical protein
MNVCHLMIASDLDPITPAPPPDPDSLFKQYRIKCDNALQNVLVHGQPEAQQHHSLEKMILELDSWIQELDNIPPHTDHADIKAMLLWQLVPSPDSCADFSLS